MNFEAIYHRAADSYCYAYDDNLFHIRLRTKKDDLQMVKVIHGDKYDWDKTVSEKLLYKMASDELFDYWQAEIAPEHFRLRYAFELASGDQTYWYTESGFCKEKPKDSLKFFDYPFLWSSEVLKPPGWVKEAIFYQIFPERFANGDPSNDPANVRPWEDVNPGPQDFYGGDLQGVLDRIDYISALGVNAIYFTPIFEAETNHKYDTTDYLKVDPHFGDMTLLKKLVNAFHDRGIRVILDAVFNHSGFWFAPFQDVVAKGPDSAYWDWFHIKEYPLKYEPRPSYHCFAFESHMPKLNTSNPEVSKYLLDVAQYWVKECDIDGWRLDVANEVDHEFWRAFRKELKAIKPDFYILGEIWHDAMPWLRGDQFDAVMNYPATEAIIDFFAKETTDAQQFAYQINRLLPEYPQQVNEAAFNILGSHDTPRLLTVCGDEKRFKLAVLFQFIFLGVPCIYYGDEVGMRGGQDPDCRRPMIWDVEEQNHTLLDFYRSLISLRKRHLALQEGSFRIIYAKNRQLVVQRQHASEQLTICFNHSEHSASVNFALQSESSPEILMGNGTCQMAENQISVNLPAFGWIILAASL
ncbi:glycoside hydrolase family 13 protein [Paenibacillus andongensis]|uniref:glycoside hydrolase family 13 protein n=1 Tax=Paenibacillus andongensis TaxID=2975482 RepID=UPI0021BB84D1|nr:glycoside hydrolase family 13 protein [Paenibacillus andongensis]